MAHPMVNIHSFVFILFYVLFFLALLDSDTCTRTDCGRNILSEKNTTRG